MNVVMPSKSFILLVAVSLLCCPLGSVHADKNDSVKLFSEGKSEYNLGNFDAAIGKFREAYRQFPAPAYLYNIAQAYRNLNNCMEAIFFYERFLAEDPDTTRRPIIEGHLADLESGCSPAEPSGASTPAEYKTSAETHSATAPIGITPTQKPIALQQEREGKTDAGSWSSRRTWAVTAGATGAVSLGIGALYALRASSHRTDALDPNIGGCDDSFQFCNVTGLESFSSAQSAADIATGAIAVGALATTIGAVLWLTSGSDAKSSGSVAGVPVAGRDSIGYMVRGVF